MTLVTKHIHTLLCRSVVYVLLVVNLFSCASHQHLPQEISTLPESQQRKYDYFFLEAIRQKNLGKYDAEFELLQHSLRVDPDGASAYYELGHLYLFLNQPDKARTAFEQAVTLSPENYWYHQTLAELYLQKNQLTEAAALLETMTQRFPLKRGVLFTLVDVYKSLNQFDQTIHTLNRLEQAMGKSEELSMEKFNAYLQKEDKAQAFGEIEGLVAEYPTDLRYRVVLGNAYLMNGRADEAYSQYTQVLAKEPNNVMAHLSLANYYEYIGSDTLARKEYEDHLLLNKEVSAETKVSIMRGLVVKSEQNKSDSTAIINLFDNMLSHDTDDDQIRMLYVQYLWSKKMEKQSLPILREILEIDPANSPARLMALQVALQNNDLPLVMELCKGGVEYYPQTMEYHFYLALSYNIAGRLDDVIQASLHALSCAPDDVKPEVLSDFYEFLGDAYYQKEQFTEAFSAYDKALEYHPKNVGVLNNYAYFLSLQGLDLDKAEAMSYQTIQAEPQNGTYLDTYAWILFLRGNYSQARLYIDQAMQHEESLSAEVVEHCGDIYYKTGDVFQAVRYWQQALEMGSDSSTLKRKIAKRKYITE